LNGGNAGERSPSILGGGGTSKKKRAGNRATWDTLEVRIQRKKSLEERELLIDKEANQTRSVVKNPQGKGEECKKKLRSQE